jgi:NADH-quinone oxidoreductase subunit L
MAPLALEVMAGVGAATAIFAASIGVLQTDIKKVLAYSTISQLGYMFLACGVGAFSAGVFHLMTHAFFKGLLFLAAGSVIHAMSGEQDMLKMGGLAKKIPTTYRTMLVATLAIAGIPPLAGFFSKDEILGRTFGVSHLLWLVGLFTAGMTAFYMFRLLILTFYGESRVSPEAEHHLHESPASMTVPLIILALLSIVGGWIGIGGRFEKFLAPVIAPPAIGMLAEGPVSPPNLSLRHDEVAAPAAPREAEKEAGEAAPESLLMILSVAVALTGIALAWFLYLKRTDLPAKIAASAGGLYRLVYQKYYVDQIYDAMFVNRTKDLALALGAFDRIFIDGLFVNGAGRLTRAASVISGWWDKWFVDGAVNLGARIFWLVSYPVRMLQTGRVGSYALLIVVGLLVFIGCYMHAAGVTMANLWH